MDSIQIIRFGAFVLSIHLISNLLEVNGGRLKLSYSNTHHRKTIKTAYGDVYDCVDLYKQPAFQHPLLKDHKIQMRPTVSQQKEVSYKGLSSNFTYGLKTGCPPGTVPIKRTTKEEELQANILFSQLFQGLQSSNGQGRFAGISTTGIRKDDISRTGISNDGARIEVAEAYISTHNPDVGTQQVSAAVISIENGSPSTNFGTIRIGWMVYPDLYKGDNRTRLFTAWGQINPSSAQGCYNTMCPGFVQVNNDIAIDMVIDQISKPGGEYAYVKLGLRLDDKKSWWLNYGEERTAVGYWPSNIFVDLQNKADKVLFGGWVATQNPNLPAMGNGMLGTDGSVMRGLWADNTHWYKKWTQTNGQVLQSPCYKAGLNPHSGGGDYWGYNIWYGGAAALLQQCPPQ